MSMLEFIDLVGQEGKDKSSKIMPSFFIAQITKIKPHIEIHFNNIKVTKPQLVYTNSFNTLVKGLKTRSSSAHIHDIEINKLKIGDEVLIYVLNDKDILIIDKVVR